MLNKEFEEIQAHSTSSLSATLLFGSFFLNLSRKFAQRNIADIRLKIKMQYEELRPFCAPQISSHSAQMSTRSERKDVQLLM